MAEIYSDKLSNLISIPQLPGELNVISNDLNSLFSLLYYRNLIAEHSPGYAEAFYSLDVILKSLLKLDVPGTGLTIIINPDLTGGHVPLLPPALIILDKYKQHSWQLRP